MASASGIVAALSSKEVAEDQFGNKFLRSFKLEGDDKWYALGKGKNEKFNIKKGKDFYAVQEGDEIEFMYEVNEYNGKDYYNVKSSNVRLVSSGVGSVSKPAGKPAAAPAKAAPASTPVARAGDAGIKVGHAINNAVQVCVAAGDTSDAAIEAVAVRILRLSKKLETAYLDIVADAPAAAPEPEKPKAKAKPVDDEPPKSVADFDDDVPF